MSHSQPLMDHVSIGTNHLEKALAFYDAVLGAIGAKRIYDVPGVGAAYGHDAPEFWVQIPHDEKTAERANGVHFAFRVNDKDSVDRFFNVALEHGATTDGDPGARPEYSDAYYGCFVRDLDGHKIEAMYWDANKASN